MTPEDADTAAKVGLSAVIVSNHGGRSLDTFAPKSRGVARNSRQGRRALATACRRRHSARHGRLERHRARCIGRTYWSTVYLSTVYLWFSIGRRRWGYRVVEILLTEFKMAMASSGGLASG